MIGTPNWEFEKEETKKIEVLDVNIEKLQVDALDLDSGMPFFLDAAKELDLPKVEVGQSYNATIKVYRAQITPELEAQWMETAKNDPELLKGIELMKTSGEAKPLYKFEVIALASLTPSI